MLLENKHFLIPVPDDWILEAKKIKAKENSQRDNHIFVSPNAWIGKLGEWAVEKVFPSLNRVTQHYNPTKYDYTSKRTDFIYEVKTKSGTGPFKNFYEFDVNNRQLERNNNDIYIACYYMLNTPHIRVIGWIWKDDVEKLGTFKEKGSLFLGKYEVKADRWSVKYNRLNELNSLPI